jgi:hypothetical protein
LHYSGYFDCYSSMHFPNELRPLVGAGFSRSMRVERVFSMVLFFPELCSRSDSNQGGTGGTGDESFPFPSAARVKSGGFTTAPSFKLYYMCLHDTFYACFITCSINPGKSHRNSAML